MSDRATPKSCNSSTNGGTSGEDVLYPNPPGSGESNHLPPGKGGQDGRPLELNILSTTAAPAETIQPPNAADITTHRDQDGEGARPRDAHGADNGAGDVTGSLHTGGKFQKLKEKRKIRKTRRLSTSGPPSRPTPPAAMEVDQSVPKSEKLEEQVPSTSQDVNSENPSEDAWLAAPGLSLEGMPEMTYNNPFFTPATSPN
ncbi:uncharacterized protein LOC132925072 [Rhopalosiphum padi]|uniref:uncharacterized protein LOC132925072 n=1 Tax=Rhopalosiphum padi TaxID=40932 RepID=UPI00298DF345|nr:uncharacterized protein LOC132925072 [Rhopalosiphum padi]